MKLTDFDYILPKELIAQYPLEKRDDARLLVLDRAAGKIGHLVFKNITDYLKPDDLLVLNDTKVLTCRLKGRRLTQGKVEVLLVSRKNSLTFDSLIKPSRVKVGERVIFNGGKTSAIVTAKNELTFSAQDSDAVYALGVLPLPPYIKREPEDLDNLYYQTVYAKEAGAVASPTAGLHFTKQLIDKIRDSGVNIGYITLHVGLGTFKPVKAEDITAHKMEKEYFMISEDTRTAVEKTRSAGGRIFAVGTTTCRTLESYARGIKQGWTDLFIYPGYKFNLVDCVLTNFHLPRTTLFMLVCAFAGEKLAKKAYQEAIDKKYRFYSYGDAMLII
ncbi:MAG: tRNA preQ1(34) S-adenosylmethionine ribosyltransferase-isomerase QueA [Candidatus Omnitrophota bacterium]